MSCAVGHRHGLDPALLWLWCTLAATASIRPPAWEPLYAVGTALKSQKTKKLYITLQKWNPVIVQLKSVFSTGLIALKNLRYVANFQFQEDMEYKNAYIGSYRYESRFAKKDLIPVKILKFFFFFQNASEVVVIFFFTVT